MLQIIDKIRNYGAVGLATIMAVPLMMSSGALAEELSFNKDQCFMRTYSPEHMAKNPAQKVTSMRFVHRPSRYVEKLKEMNGADFQPRDFQASFDVSFRKDSKRYEQGLLCATYDGVAYCGVECDGGRFAYRFKKNGSVLIDFRKTGAMMLETSCEENAKTRWLGDSKEDQLFRLDPAPMAACKGLNAFNF